ncbi:hypothetical protein HDU98_001031 [Podochytrium sp. JEL0797]|nr:hypothetical protein HDU98_001031 [Podochytrium sp. JEL0797]
MACQWSLLGPPNYVAVIEFSFIDTECGWDFVYIFDGDSIQSPQVATLCGNRSVAFGYNDLFASSTNAVILDFQSDQAVTRRGFLAVFNFVLANEQGPSNNTQYIPRELHSASYDPSRDIMIIMGGHTLDTVTGSLNDILIYNFTSSNWWYHQPTSGELAPAQRSGHFTFMMNGAMFLYGGVTYAEDSDMLWSYNIDANKWNPHQTIGEFPPMFEGAAYVFVNSTTGQSPTLYVFGGYVPYASSFELSRMLYALDLTTLTWTLLNNSPYPSWAPTGVYHKNTNSLYFTGGYRFAESPFQPTLQYQIDSQMWFNGASQPFHLSMSYATSFIDPANPDTMVTWGGYPATLSKQSDVNVACFSQQFQFYDINCQTWSYADVPSGLFLRRKGHSMVVRRGQVVVFGGMNGYFLNDLAVLDVVAAPVNSSAASVKECRAQNWCTNEHYWCQDCMARPYCAWCGSTCNFNGVLASMVPDTNPTSFQCPAGNPASVCPAVSSIAINQTITETITTSSSAYKDYTFNCDYPLFDITITSTPSPNTTITITLLSIRSPIYTNTSSTSAYISIPATDPARYSGPYTFRVSYSPINSPGINNVTVNVSPKPSLLNRQVAIGEATSTPTGAAATASNIQNPHTSFTVSVIIAPNPLFKTNLGGGGSTTTSPGILDPGTGFNQTSSIALIAMSLLVTSLTVYLVQKSREAIRRRRGRGGPEVVASVTRDPPPFYKVEMCVPVVNRSASRGSAATGGGGAGGRVSVGSGRKDRILSSARMEGDEIRSSCTRSVPLSIEPILPTPSQPTKNTASKRVIVNRIIIFPGCDALLAKGHVPPVAIGSTVCEYIENPPAVEKKGGKRRWFGRKR